MLGLDCVMLAPMICGFPAMQALVRDFPDMALFAHPSLGGAARIAPELLIGGLFRLIGRGRGDLPEFRRPVRLLAGDMPAAGGQCARGRTTGMKAGLPVPAGGMTLERIRGNP